jgi:rhodanese-related sulfurtransferase
MHRALAVVTAVVLSLPALAGEWKKDAFGQVSVDQLVSLRKAKAVTILDANDVETRNKMGVIPGATLLTSFEKYELAQLPASKSSKLVFYCANTMCTASHAAAERAVTAGYKDVAVLPAGIEGWVEAGQAVNHPGRS